MAALEGDIKMKTDECAIYKPSTASFEILRTPQRSANKFLTAPLLLV
jgi:hypothetical protein